MNEGLLPAELARMCGVSADTIRHYERKGVIPPPVRGVNGYRRFPPETAERVRLIRRAVAIGFSLDEIARMFRQRAAGAPPCRQVRALAAEKLAELDRRIAEMAAIRGELAAMAAQWDVRLAATPEGEPARLLESINEGEHHEDSHRYPHRHLASRRLRR